VFVGDSAGLPQRPREAYPARRPSSAPPPTAAAAGREKGLFHVHGQDSRPFKTYYLAFLPNLALEGGQCHGASNTLTFYY
jgi:hypothetical protein